MPIRNLAVVAGALLLSVSAAPAQELAQYKSAAYTPGTEEVIVTAPDIHMERGSIFGLPGKATLSRRVAFNDLDLTEPSDARMLRQRVRDTARDVCDTLRDAYPVHEQPGTSCYRDALKDAMPRADAAIREARTSARYR